MNYHKFGTLIKQLKNSKRFSVLKQDDIPKAVVSEHGGRLLGIFPRKNGLSLTWINLDLKEEIQANGYNIGGERYWISPERAFFYEDPRNWKGWFCPPSLDPANYQIQRMDEVSCTVRSKISLVNQFTKGKHEGEITRIFKIIEEPVSTGLEEYCGVEISEECWLNKKNLEINGWSLTKVISSGPRNPGTVIIPTQSNPKPLSYFRYIPEDRLIISKDHVSFKIDVSDIYKLAIRPEDIRYDLPAKISYITQLPDSKDYGLLIKLSNDIPRSQAECHDISRDHPDIEIGVIQSYNSESIDENKLSFGEIELQLNPFKTQGDISMGNATHQLIGYVGSKYEILGALQKYLKIEDPYLF
ncbi:MAG: DUF6786 family protein [Promethearchaeota archaeon]